MRSQLLISTSSINYIYIMDHLHGLCKDCVTNCTEIYAYSKNQSQCSRCNETQPDIIYEDNGSISVLCTKCYIKQTSSPRPRIRSEYTNNSNKLNNSIILTPVQNNPLFHSISKSDIINNKGFFTNQGKMIKKIQKYFSKFQGKTQDAIKELSKKSAVSLASLSWDKIVFTCNKTASLMFVLANQSHLFGFYHNEPVKIGQKIVTVQDKESGFFVSSKSKLDLQFYKSNNESIAYNPQNRTISLGKPACLQVIFQGARPKVRCDIFQSKIQEWPQFYIYRL